MASTSLAYAARQNAVAPISSTPDRSVLKLVNQTFFLTRAFTSAPLARSSFIRSRYESFCCRYAWGCGYIDFGPHWMFTTA